MNSLEFRNVSEWTQVAAAACQPIGSLAHPAPFWKGPFVGLVRAVKAGNFDAARDFAEAIVSESVPVVGDPHPRRATVGGIAGILFTTPNDVIVRFTREDGQVNLKIIFNRDSRRLASQILATVFLAHSSGPVRVDDDTRDRYVKSALIRALSDLGGGDA